MSKFIKLFCTFALLIGSAQAFGQGMEGDCDCGYILDPETGLYGDIDPLQNYPAGESNGGGDNNGEGWNGENGLDWQDNFEDLGGGDFWNDFWSDFDNDHWGDGRGGGGIGQGNNNNSLPTGTAKYAARSDAHFANASFNTSLPEGEYKQPYGAGYCVMYCMYFINKHCLGGNANPNMYIKSYNSNLNKVWNEGVKSEKFVKFVKKHFVTSNFSEVTDAIDAGSYVIVDIGTHAIAVVGYTDDGNFIFLDPDYGELLISIPYAWYIHYIKNFVCITGLKN